MAKPRRNANDDRRSDSAYVPAPLQLPAFPNAIRVRGKTAMPGGGLRQRWKNRAGSIYEWDYRHGRVEVYDRRGRHIGKCGPVTGVRTQPPNPDYQVDP
jgi:hypothetical protein